MGLVVEMEMLISDGPSAHDLPNYLPSPVFPVPVPILPITPHFFLSTSIHVYFNISPARLVNRPAPPCPRHLLGRP